MITIWSFIPHYIFGSNSEKKSFKIENNSIDFDFFHALKSFLAAADLLIHICIHASNFGKWHFHMFPASILKKKGLCMSKFYDNYVFIWIKCHSPMTISCWIKSQRPSPLANSMAKWEFLLILNISSFSDKLRISTNLGKFWKWKIIPTKKSRYIGSIETFFGGSYEKYSIFFYCF